MTTGAGGECSCADMKQILNASVVLLSLSRACGMQITFHGAMPAAVAWSLLGMSGSAWALLYERHARGILTRAVMTTMVS